MEARDDGQTGCLAQECNDEWRCFHPVPFGLRIKKGHARLLRCLAEEQPRLHFAPCAWPF
jgi:hypothetical protein